MSYKRCLQKYWVQLPVLRLKQFYKADIAVYIWKDVAHITPKVVRFDIMHVYNPLF